jgi:predicted amidohydrolase YtcJ
MKSIMVAAFAAAVWAAPASSQIADTILVNGKIVTVDEKSPTVQAMAIRDGRIAALGTPAEIRKLAGKGTRTIDLAGRTVIPGLIDSHMHAIRAALSFSTEVNWIGAASLTEALARIHEASQTMKPGAWLIVAGGWNVQQFKEKRRPTQAELLAAAPDNPVYVQLGYGWVMMTPLGYKALNISSNADLPGGGKLDGDGGITGGNNAIVALFDKLPRPNFEEQVAGTKKFFRELNRLGITGVVDPGGNNLGPEDYEAVFKVWRDGQMTVRVAYTLCGQTPGAEFEELKSLTQLLPMGFGDEMLRFNGIGERITAAMNNNNKPSEAEKQKYYEIVKWAAERGMSLTMHWTSDQSVDQLLGIFERVNKEVPIAGLRW